jgi:ribosome recycling factor
MPTADVIAEAKQRMKRAAEKLEQEFATIRTGRASAAILDRVKVSYYGSEMPINQLATVSIPEARLIVITPWDKGSLRAIEKAILTSDLNLTPSSDGNVVRLEIPALTEERRKELAKLVSQKAEDGRVAIRNIRRDANTHIEKLEKSSDVSEDDVEHAKKEIQDVTNAMIKEIDRAAEKKTAEVMEV